MLGVVRFILAGMVVANHFWFPVANKVGAHAVTAFYMISGYLMARVLNTNYGFSLTGIQRFLLNRFLRIYPTYWIVFLFSCLCLYLDQNSFAVQGTLMQIPSNASEWLKNIVLYDLTWSPIITIPPAWALAIEIFFYIAMPFLLSRTKQTTYIWFVISLVITISLNISGASFRNRYYPAYAASLFFSAGAMIFYYWKHLERFIPNATFAVLFFALFIPFPLIVEAFGGDRFALGYYGASLLFLPVLLWAIVSPLFKYSRVLGDLAYPMFLMHFLGAGIVRLIWGPGITGNAGMFFGLVFIVTFLLALGTHLGFERQINRIRARVRPQLAQ
jgi:peptidoglycan/LPS O-acetylase OafA/YrhL